MEYRVITATEAARNFSAVLSEVRYQAARFEIVKGREVVARLVPSSPAGKLAVAELGAFFAAVPHLAPDDVDAFEADIAAARRQLAPPRDPWA